MAGTRKSTRQAAQTSSSPPPSAKTTSSGTKRKADDSTPVATTKAKRRRPSQASKQQKTLEETMPEAEEPKEVEQNGKSIEEPKDCSNWEQQSEKTMKEGQNKEVVMKDAEAETDGKVNGDGEHKEDSGEKVQNDPHAAFMGETTEGESKANPEKALKDSRGGAGLNALDQVKADESEPGKTSVEEPKTHGDVAAGADTHEPAVQEDKQREEAQPDNVMEKGIIYFFTRGRVGIDDPDNVQELQRSFFVLRPLPAGGKITAGAIQDVSNNRLIAVPKKVWPKSGCDKFMAFVEKAGVSMDTLKEEFFKGSDYSTKTTGTRHTPEVTPIGEGVYAMTWTGSGRTTTHLSYMLNIPQELGEVQKDVGLAEKGSFVLSTKNPESSGPSYAQLPQGPEYPKEMIEEFGSRGWLPTKPEHLDYANGQVLLIGESFDPEATQHDSKDDSKETPIEELEKLEHEDEIRIEHMKGDDTVFADLGISSKDYPSVKSTW